MYCGVLRLCNFTFPKPQTQTHAPSPSRAILMDLSRYTAAEERGYSVIQCNIMHGRRQIKLQEHNILPTIHKKQPVTWLYFSNNSFIFKSTFNIEQTNHGPISCSIFGQFKIIRTADFGE